MDLDLYEKCTEGRDVTTLLVYKISTRYLKPFPSYKVNGPISDLLSSAWHWKWKKIVKNSGRIEIIGFTEKFRVLIN